MKDLHAILKAVSRGKMEIAKAEELIQELFEKSVVDQQEEAPSPRRRSQTRGGAVRSSQPKVSKAKDVVDLALANLGEKIGFDAWLKRSRELGRQVEFRPTHAGFDCKLSIFTGVDFGEDTLIEDNVVSGSQWKSSEFAANSEVRKNHFTLSQVSRLSCQRSNFSANEFGLTRLASLTVQESRFENNRLSRTQLVDFAMSEADFTHNRLLRSEFNGVVVNASRIAHLVVTSCRWTECEFDQSDLQGLRFEDCSFSECRFSNCEIVVTDPKPLTGLRVHGVVFEGLRSLEDLLSALEPQENRQHNEAHPARKSGQAQHRERRPRDQRH